jgi:hypothetical protein
MGAGSSKASNELKQRANIEIERERREKGAREREIEGYKNDANTKEVYRKNIEAGRAKDIEKKHEEFDKIIGLLEEREKKICQGPTKAEFLEEIKKLIKSMDPVTKEGRNINIQQSDYYPDYEYVNDGADKTYTYNLNTILNRVTLMEGGASSKSVIRHYVVVRTSLGKIGGRYASNSGPAAAAKKAASTRFGIKNKMRITVRQTGSDREFTYDATREKLAKPVVRRIAGVMVATSEYRIVVKAAKK